MQENRKYLLDAEWRLTFTEPLNEKRISTNVEIPCNIEPVLVRLGLIDDYLPADNDSVTIDFESVDDWTYTKKFKKMPLEEGYKRELVFEGIDTIAEIYLNGEKIQDCMDMHMTYRIDITDKLCDGENELKVIIRSSELWARKYNREMLVESRHATSALDSQAFLRKARHQWGWDNAPRLLTSGIVRSVYIEDLVPSRFEEVYFYTKTVEEENVSIGAAWTIDAEDKNLKDYKMRFSLVDDEKIVYELTKRIYFTQGTFRCDIPREKIKLWWPAGYGEPNMYMAKLELYKGEELKAKHEEKFGIRTLKLVRTEDVTASGEGEFAFYVNGIRIFAKGTNWKPLDPLCSLADIKTREGRALEEIKNLHCNMVRIWGGGIYEDEFFFDYCDKNGIMVWQDFMFACEVPPAGDEFIKLVEAEAVQIIKKYRNHPSLAVWCGDNEDDLCIGWISLGSEALPSDNIITRKILKNTVIRNDPYRSYVASSPYESDRSYTGHRKSDREYFTTEGHLYPFYKNVSASIRAYKGYFAGEVAPGAIYPMTANDEIFKREEERAKRLWNSDEEVNAQFHQADGYFARWRKACRDLSLSEFSRDFTIYEWKDMACAVNIFSAQGYKEIIEYSRVMFPRKTGVLWWSLIDMWPMLFNVSVIDCDYKRKLPYYWIRQAQQDFVIVGVRKELNGELALYAVNNTLNVHKVEYTVTAYDENCDSRQIAAGIAEQKENSSDMIQRIAEPEQPQLWIIKWEENGEKYMNHVLTKMPEFKTAKKWVKIIEENDCYGN